MTSLPALRNGGAKGGRSMRLLSMSFIIAATPRLPLARDVDIVGAGLLQRQPDEFAAALDRAASNRARSAWVTSADAFPRRMQLGASCSGGLRRSAVENAADLADRRRPRPLLNSSRSSRAGRRRRCCAGRPGCSRRPARARDATSSTTWTASSSRKPWRSWWPTMAAPAPLLVQLPQVRSSPAGNARPSGCEPVSTSCRLGVSPRPLITSPFSLSAVCLVSLLLALCRSSTFCAITTPLAFCHGPRPMRSRAFTAPSPCVLRYARQVLVPAPAACASVWQCRSAPSRPPRSAPLPGPALVTKNVMVACCAKRLALVPSAISAPAAAAMQRVLFMRSSPV